MTLPPVARRSLALVASTALLTSGLTGLLASPAFAVANDGVPTSISPTLTNNSGNSAITVTGTNFNPATDKARLKSQFASALGAAGSYVLDGTTNQSSSSTTSLVGTLPSANAAPGKYDVYTARTDITGTTESVKCAGTTDNPCVFTINSSGAPSLSSVLPGASTGSADRGNRALDLGGQNLAEGSSVDFYLADGTTVDKGLTFTVGDPNDSSGTSGYASSSLIRGSYGFGSTSFTPGKHLIKVTNTVNETGAGVEFWQPKFDAAGISPATTGAGTNNKTITIKGQGIRQGSRISIEVNDLDPLTPGTQPDLSVGAATVSADGTTISAPVSVDSGADTGTARDIGILGPDGARETASNAFTITAPPTLGSLDTSALGQGATYTETISGSNFAAGNTAGSMPVFTVSGTGVTTKTLSSTNISAQVQFTVAKDAPVGNRSVTVTNPDGGSTTKAPSSTSSPFTVDAGPTISSISPPSAPAGTSKTVTITGTDFDSNGVSVVVSLPPTGGAARTPDPSMSVGPVTVTKGSNGAADKATFTLSIAGNAPAGLRDVTLTNDADHGNALCAGCFGVDNLTVSPASGANNTTKQVQLTGAGVVAGSSAKLVRAGDPTIQPAIPGTAATVSGTTLTATFDLTDAAPGAYNAIVTTPSGATLSCTQCFTVTGSTPTITSISPAAGGQGATNLPITVTGTNFSRGEQLTITDVLVHNVVWVNRTTLTAKVDIASNAPTGAKTAKVTNADGALSGSKSSAFTVTPPPDPTSSSPASFGQGAKGVKITVKGPNFMDGATADFGPGITVTGVAVTQGTAVPLLDPNPDDTLEATVTIAENAVADSRTVTVINPDGGTGTLPNGFAVSFGPKVTSVTPAFLAPNAVDKPVTIAGSNFSTTSGKTAVPTAAGITFKNVVVASDGNSITATASVNSGTAKGLKDVVVTNPTDSGAGTCAGCLAVATPPGAPTGLAVTSSAAGSITVRWTAPTDNGGAPITSYVVSAKDASGHDVGTPGTTSGSARTGTVSGLQVGTHYTVLVTARNVAGDSTPATISALSGGKATTVSVAQRVINIGKGGTGVSATGTPGHVVWLWAYSRPSTKYVAVRKSTFDANGFASFVVSPRTNTRLFAKDMSANLSSASTTISVHPALSLKGAASGKFGSFSGTYVPGQGGAAIRLFTVKNGVRSASPVGTATTDSLGHWTYSRNFAAHGPVTFIVQSLANLNNASGQGNRVTVTFS